MTDLTHLLAQIPCMPVEDLACLAPQLAACLKAVEVQLALRTQSKGADAPDTYLSITEVAQLLGVNKSYVTRYGREIPGRIVLGRNKILYSRKALEAGLGVATTLAL